MTAIKQFQLEKYHEFDHQQFYYYTLQLLVNSLQYFILSQQQIPNEIGTKRYHHQRIITQRWESMGAEVMYGVVKGLMMLIYCEWLQNIV